MGNLKMKSIQTLAIFVCLILINSFLCSKSKSQTNDKYKPFRGYYYIQRFFPGNDALDSIRESEFHTKLMMFEVNKDVIFFAKSLARIKDIEDSIMVKDLYDPKIDDMRSGSCCTRMKYQEFPAATGLAGILPVRAQNKKKGKKPLIKKKKICVNKCDKNPLLAARKKWYAEQKLKKTARMAANFCLELFVPDEARWRICHKSQDRISALHMKLIYFTLNANFRGKMNVISGFLAKARVGREEPMDHWSWEAQNKWKGRCKSTLMQSPINLTKANVKQVSKAFNVAYNFLPVYTMMKRNEKEIIATFMNFGGTVQLSIGGTFVLFTPTYMSFRFPGEHMFEGRRYMGEIILHLVEMSSQRKNSVSNGLNITIPIKPSKKGLNISSFERLNIDFWRYEVEKKGAYTPKKFLKKKLLAFNLGNIFRRVMAGHPESVFYMGSHTTPPCEENTYHMVFTKPIIMSGCQFKLLREHSLLSHKTKNIHARREEPLSDRTVYKYNTGKMKFIKNINSILPPAFNKYLLKKGGYKKKHKIICTKRGCFKRKLKKKKMINCKVPNEKQKAFNVKW